MRLECGQAGYHCARACKHWAGEGHTADFVRAKGATYRNRPAQRTEDKMVDGDDKQQYSAGDFQIVNLDVEDSGQDLFAGKRKYYQYGHTNNNGGVECLSALALRDMLDYVEKNRDIADRVDNSKKGQD